MTDYGFEIHRQNISTKKKTCFKNDKLSWFDANKQTSELNSKYDGYFYYVAFYQDYPDDVSIDYSTHYYRYDICGKCQYLGAASSALVASIPEWTSMLEM